LIQVKKCLCNLTLNHLAARCYNKRRLSMTWHWAYVRDEIPVLWTDDTVWSIQKWCIKPRFSEVFVPFRLACRPSNHLQSLTIAFSVWDPSPGGCTENSIESRFSVYCMMILVVHLCVCAMRVEGSSSIFSFGTGSSSAEGSISSSSLFCFKPKEISNEDSKGLYISYIFSAFLYLLLVRSVNILSAVLLHFRPLLFILETCNMCMCNAFY